MKKRWFYLILAINIALAGLTLLLGIGGEVGVVSAGRPTPYGPQPYALEITKTAQDLSGGLLYVGDTIQYAIWVTNSGSLTQTNLTLWDNLPAGTHLLTNTIQNSPGLTLTLSPLTLFTDTFPAQTALTLTFELLVEGGAINSVITNTAGVTSTEQFTPTLTPPIVPANGGLVHPYSLYLPAIMNQWRSPNWYTQGLSGLTVYALASCNNRLFAGTNDGVWVRDPAGTWQQSLPQNIVRAVAVTSDCANAYATTWGNYVHKSIDNGQQWQPISTTQADSQYSYALVIQGGIVYLGVSGHGVYNDLITPGAFNELWESSLAVNVSVLGFGTSPAGTLFAPTWGENIYQYTQAGWQTFGNPPTDNKVYTLLLDSNNTPLAAATDTSLYDWANNSWQLVNSQRTPTLAANGTTLYAGQEGGNGVLVKLLNQSWQSQNAGFPTPIPNIRALLVLVENEQKWLYAGTSNGLWRYPIP